MKRALIFLAALVLSGVALGYSSGPSFVTLWTDQTSIEGAKTWLKQQAITDDSQDIGTVGAGGAITGSPFAWDNNPFRVNCPPSWNGGTITLTTTELATYTNTCAAAGSSVVTTAGWTAGTTITVTVVGGGDAGIVAGIGRGAANNLAVDTNVLMVNGLTNRVGVNTTNPTVALDVTGAILASTTITATGDLAANGSDLTLGTGTAQTISCSNAAASTLAFSNTGAGVLDITTDGDLTVGDDLTASGGDFSMGTGTAQTLQCNNAATCTLAISNAGAGVMDLTLDGDLTVSGSDISGGTGELTLNSAVATTGGQDFVTRIKTTNTFAAADVLLTIANAASAVYQLRADGLILDPLASAVGVNGGFASAANAATECGATLGTTSTETTQFDVCIGNDVDGTFVNVATVDGAGNMQIDGDLAITGGNITTALTCDSTLVVTGDVTLNGGAGALALNGAIDQRLAAIGIDATFYGDATNTAYEAVYRPGTAAGYVNFAIQTSAGGSLADMSAFGASFGDTARDNNLEWSSAAAGEITFRPNAAIFNVYELSSTAITVRSAAATQVADVVVSTGQVRSDATETGSFAASAVGYATLPPEGTAFGSYRPSTAIRSTNVTCTVVVAGSCSACADAVVVDLEGTTGSLGAICASAVGTVAFAALAVTMAAATTYDFSLSASTTCTTNPTLSCNIGLALAVSP